MNIKVDVSEASLSHAADLVRAYAREMTHDLDEITATLANVGKAMAVSIVAVESGELASSIQVEKVADGHYQLVADSPHAAFHEFGTGVVGQGTYPYPFPVPWVYGSGDGFHTSEGGWYYEDPKGTGEWHYTRGQRGRAFMAQAAEAMRQEITPLTKAVIG